MENNETAGPCCPASAKPCRTKLCLLGAIYKTLAWIAAAYTVLLIAYNWFMYFSAPASARAQGDLALGAASSVYYIVIGGAVAVSFYAAAEVIASLSRIEKKIVVPETGGADNAK